MKVEVFIDDSVANETEQQSAEVQTLCEELGLRGQLRTSTTDVVLRNPYRLMRDDELFVYSVLCPEKCKAEDFRDEPIPLDVLKVLKNAKSLNLPELQHFEIWAASSRLVKDPVLVGMQNYYSNARYILARWGEELLPLEVLIPDAIKKWYSARKTKLLKMRTEIDFALAQPVPEVITSDLRLEAPTMYL